MRLLDFLMTALFGFAVIVQFNDPDPVRWAIVYAAACVLSGIVAAGYAPSRPLFVVVAAVGVIWGVLIAVGGPGATQYTHMFDAWEMKSVDVEEAREATGLLIVAAWMTVLYMRSVRRQRQARG